MAGVTLFAFAGGAPDLLTQVAALLGSSRVDIGLAASSTLGSGLFVLGIVLPTVIVLAPHVIILEPRTFLRDTGTYLVSMALMVLTVSLTPIRPWQPALMLVMYCLYIGACLVGRRRGSDRRRSLSLELEAAAGTACSRPLSVSALLGLQGRAGWDLAAALLRCPFPALLHATIPTLGTEQGRQGHLTMCHAIILALLGPGFFLTGVGLGPGALGMLPCTLLWLALAGLAGVLMLRCAAHGAGDKPLDLGAAQHRSTRRGVPLLSWRWQAPQPSCLLACLGLIQSIVWMHVVADETVAVFQAIGRAAALPDDLLGATVLAWGQGIPDLVAATSIARAGNRSMAMAACFGGPVFNVLVAFGVPTLVATWRVGPLPYSLPDGVRLLLVASVTLVIVMLLVVPMVCAWRADARVAASLLLTFAACQITFVLVEQGWL